MKKPVPPKFATEREEADWWYANRAVIEQNFAEALEKGTFRRDIVKRIADERAAKKPTPAKSN